MINMLKYFLILLLIIASSQLLSAQNRVVSPLKFEQVFNSPVEIVQLGESHYFIDFGKTYFGTVMLKSKTPQADAVIIHLGEKADSSGQQVDRTPGGTIRYQRAEVNELKPNKLTAVALTPDTRNTKPQAIPLPDTFGIVLPFRYCEIENLQVPIEDLTIYQKGFHYVFNDEASYFYSSDPVLDSIYDLCKHTIKATSFTGFYVDGDRERIPYEADAFINQLSHYAVDSIYDVARRTNEYFIDHATWPTEWLLHTALMYYYDFLYTNDATAIKRYYDNLKVKSLMALEGENGFISTRLGKLSPQLIVDLGFDRRHESIKDIVDWPKAERDNYEFKEINTVVNAFYYENLRVMSIIASQLGKSKDAELYKQKAEKVKNSIQTYLIDEDTGLFTDGLGSEHSSLHANMFPLAFDLVPEKNQRQVIDFIKSKGMACSVYGAQYLLEGLCKYGESAHALSLITEKTGDRNWYHMIKTGGTLTWEAWDIAYKSNLDWNHAWGTAPLNIIVRHIWGITPDEPGFKKINIAPKLGYLSHSEIKVPTQHGCVVGEYRSSENEKHHYAIELPPGSTARFFIDKSCKKVKLNNKKGIVRDGYIELQSVKNNIQLEF